MNKLLLVLLMMLINSLAKAQVEGGVQLGGGTRQYSSPTSAPTGAGRSGQKDTIGFQHRDDAKDSINISFRYLDSLRSLRLDTVINDFSRYYVVPWTLQYLGNSGAASYPLIFSPLTKTGIDPGFHAFDTYKFTIEGTRFFKTTRPFTQINYQLASGKEQMIKIIHAQSPRPNLNFGLEYQLLNSPGFFVNQNANHSSYRLYSNYQSKRKRYAAYFFLLGNSVKNSENGGMVNNSYLDSPLYSKRFAIPVNLSFSSSYTPNPFNSFVSTGNKNKDFTIFYRHSYDLGKRDSVQVNDSTTEYLFYPKLRFQHTFIYSYNNNTYIDTTLLGRKIDSALYKQWYDTTISRSLKHFELWDSWKTFSNDFSILQFPDTKNPGQYLLAGARLENITGSFSASGEQKFYNIIVHGEYRNKTRNKLWDMVMKGEFYTAGFNSGDYSAFASLSRYFSKRWGSVTLQFQNVNRSPSFIFNGRSSFNFNGSQSLSKENITIIKASADNSFVSLFANNYLISNYTYFTDYYHTDQYSRIINILQLGANKKIRISRRWNLYSEAIVQITDASSPIRLPLFLTRNRLAYEGRFFKNNLNLSTGLEIKYNTPFKAYDYSPMMGQFFPQNDVSISNRPDVHAFLHFRIRSFGGYIRAENLNSLDFSNGFGFTRSNFAAPHYIYPGYIFRFGIQWNFVN